MTSHDDYWKFIVRKLGTPTVLLGTDDESDAVRFALKCDDLVKIIRTSNDQVIYEN